MTTYKAKKSAANKALKISVKSLIEHVRNYDSDTFLAREKRVTRNEAKQIAARLIEDAIENLDGLTLDGELELVREEVF